MLLVGLTGNIGSGKTTAARLFGLLGVPVYSADEKGRFFLNQPTVQKQVEELFGPEVVDPRGSIDRKKLASLVFGDPSGLARLNTLIHPLVREDFRKWVRARQGHHYVIQEAAILFESGQAEQFHRVILVTAPLELRIERVCSRDGVSSDAVMKRVRHQMDEDLKRPHADYLIANNGNDLLIPQVLKVHDQLLGISR